MSWALRNTLYVSAIVVIPYIYVAWRLLNSVKFLWPDHIRKSRLIIIAVMGWLNSLPIVMIYYYFKETLLDEFVYRTQANFLDWIFLFPFWIGVILLVEILPYFLASDFLQTMGRLFFPHFKDAVRKWSAIFRIALLALFSIYVISSIFSDTYTISESQFNIKVNNLPRGLDNLNLALVADLQVDRFTQSHKINGLKDIIKNNEPDLLFFAGDLVTRGNDFIDQGIAAMCDLQAGTERVACIGDHDYWANPEKISSALQNCGWTFLNNAHRIINYQNTKILVTGVTYIYSQRISSNQLTALLKNAPQADLKILLVHQPAKMVIEVAEKFGYDILLAGHTHGGQIVFKPFGFDITPIKFETGFYSGYYKKNNLNIFVSNGIGLTLMPLRFRAAAEVTNIILQN